MFGIRRRSVAPQTSAPSPPGRDRFEVEILEVDPGEWVIWTTGEATGVGTCLGNLVIGARSRAGPVNLAAALRFHSRNPHRPLATLGISLG